MGRSGGYCFKIIACGGSSESVDRDDLDASSENKVADKRGWSFRKKSASQRVLNNTVITEITTSEDKISEPVIINSEFQINSEKNDENKWIEEELPRASTSTTKDNTVSKTKAADEVNIEDDFSHDESSVIVIQTAVRKFLAKREVMKHKKVVKLQAVVRGHLVRCRAAGTLRCIQAIVKMQILVRANLSVGKSNIRKKGIQDSKTKPHPTYISIEKLLSNRFAIQILESTPRTKQINIKCDPSKDDSSWKWMERWMSASKHEHDDNKNQFQNEIFEQKIDSISCENGPTLSPEKPVMESKRAAIDQADSDGRKSVFGLRNPSNPSRFQELTSKTNSLTFSSQEHATSSPADKTESLVYESLRVGQSQSPSQTGGSECGTELSVTSMLDSPDPSEIGNTETDKNVKESKDLQKTVSNEEHDLLGTELTHSILPLSEKYDFNDQNESPKNQKTTLESQQTPSSSCQLSTKTKPDEKVSNQKPKSWSKSNSQKSPVTFDHLPRDTKTGKRRNSFGSQSQSSDQHVDQEPRDSSSSNNNSNNYIPSYMQVTESAKLKSLANNSAKSSPDVQSKEAYLKKRHSMPGGRHGSPRVKRSPPQTTKGNDNRERKWQN